MPVNLILYISVVWASAIFLTLAVVIYVQQRHVVVFRDVWRLLLAVVATYSFSYTLSSVTYTAALIYTSDIIVWGSKSLPGIMAIASASVIILMLCCMAAFVVEPGGVATVARRMALKEPLLGLTVVMGVASAFWAVLSPSEAYLVPIDGDTIPVYTPPYLGFVGVVVCLALYPLIRVWRYSKRSYEISEFSSAIRVLAGLIYLQAIVGYNAMLSASFFLVDTYQVMGVTYALSSFLGVGLLYSELLKPYHALKPPYQVATEPQRSGLEHTLIRYSVELDYASPIQAFISGALRGVRVMIFARSESPLLSLSFEGVEVSKSLLATSGITLLTREMLPANNLSLVASVIVASSQEKPTCVVIDDLTFLSVVNSVREVYIFLAQVMELAKQATIIALINWKAMSDRDYSLIAQLFSKIATVEKGKLVYLK